MKSLVIKISVILLLIIATITQAVPVSAIPALPHAFYGSVQINGSPAPNGTSVSATVGVGTVVSVQNPVVTAGGQYGVDGQHLLVQGDIQVGTTITFFVNGVDTGKTAVYEPGGGPTEVALSITVSEDTPEIPEQNPVVPSGGGGGGGYVTPPQTEVEVNILGQTGTIDIDDEGVIQETIYIGNSETITVFISQGVKALQADGEPIENITVNEVTEILPSIPDSDIIGIPYDFGPDGAMFDPAIILTFLYNPDDLPEGVTPGTLKVAYYDENSGQWVELPVVSDPGLISQGLNQISVAVNHFTMFALIGEVTEVTEEETIVEVPEDYPVIDEGDTELPDEFKIEEPAAENESPIVFIKVPESDEVYVVKPDRPNSSLSWQAWVGIGFLSLAGIVIIIGVIMIAMGKKPRY